MINDFLAFSCFFFPFYEHYNLAPLLLDQINFDFTTFKQTSISKIPILEEVFKLEPSTAGLDIDRLFIKVFIYEICFAIVLLFISLIILYIIFIKKIQKNREIITVQTYKMHQMLLRYDWKQYLQKNPILEPQLFKCFSEDFC
jgi:hypothetical protein